MSIAHGALEAPGSTIAVWQPWSDSGKEISECDMASPIPKNAFVAAAISGAIAMPLAAQNPIDTVRPDRTGGLAQADLVDRWFG